ncbi:hypothetical protein Tco_0144754 [Tanacetum coccineum]
MGIRHAKTHTLHDKVFDETRAEGRLQLMIDQDFTCFKFYEEWSQVKTLTLLNSSERISSSKLIPGKPVNRRRSCVELAIEKIATVRLPKKKRTETVIEQSGQSEGIKDKADSEETKEEDEIPLVQRQTRVVIGRRVHQELDEEALDHSKQLKGVERISETTEFLLKLKQAKKASKQDFILQQHPKSSSEGSGVNPEVPDGLSHKSPNEGSGITLVVLDEPRDGSSSLSLDSEEEIEDISSDDESLGVDDTKKADANKVNDDKVDKEQHMDEQAETDQPKKVQAEDSVPKLQKSRKPETKVDTDVLDTRLTRLEKKVKAVSKFNIPESIDKFVQAHLKKNVLPKDGTPQHHLIKLLVDPTP